MKVIVILLALLTGVQAKALSTEVPKTLIHFGASYIYPPSSPPSFTSPWAAELSVGFITSKVVYWGFALDYWLAQRSYLSGPTQIVDSLQYYNGGVEVGYLTGNPRVYWLATAGVFYPIGVKVSSTNGLNYQSASRFWSVRARLLLGIRMTPWLAFSFGGGYRINQLGNLYSSTETFLPSGASLNLSGFFLSGNLVLVL